MNREELLDWVDREFDFDEPCRAVPQIQEAIWRAFLRGGEVARQEASARTIAALEGHAKTIEAQRQRIVELERQVAELRGEVTAPDNHTGKWCYSNNGEEFCGPFDTEQEAHAEALGYAGDGRSYWIGRIKHPADCLARAESIGYWIIEQADEQAYDQCGGDDPAFDFSTEQYIALGNMVREFIRREGTVNRWAVIDSKQYEAPAAPVQKGE